MQDEVLSSIRPSFTARAVYILDRFSLLALHRPRLCAGILFSLFVLFVYTVTSGVTVVSDVVPPKSEGLAIPDPEALGGGIAESAAIAEEQQLNYERLSRYIDAHESSFDEEDLLVQSHPVTAVLLAWKRPRGLELVVRHLAKHPFIREIIVWNNDVSRDVSPLDFATHVNIHDIDIRVVNSPANVHDGGKHMACAMASYDYCYFNDDDWLNTHIDAQFLAHTHAPHTIVSNTMPYIHWEHRRWRFVNYKSHITSGFSWLGCGSFTPRNLSRHFVMKQQSGLSQPMTASQARLGDMYFSLWTNEFPLQMPNDLTPIDVDANTGVGWSQNVDQWAIVYGNIHDALHKLYREREIGNSDFPPSKWTSPYESDIRAPCSDDSCLFTTSLTPFIPPHRIVAKDMRKRKGFRRPAHNPSFGIHPSHFDHILQYEDLFNLHADGWPSVDWWLNEGSWHLAVNGDPKTCWASSHAAAKTDHFGLLFVKRRTVRDVTVLGSNIAQWQLQVLGQQHSEWTPVKAQVSQAPLGAGLCKTVFTFDAQAVSGLRWVSLGGDERALRVCSIDAS